jgi:hypothetical protein
VARHKDTNWKLPEGQPNGKGGSTHEYNSIHSALLMDIRDELKLLNERIQCLEFIQIPRTLRTIARNTAKKKGVRKATR